MKPVKTFSTELEANLAKIELEGAGIPSVVVGIALGVDVSGDGFGCDADVGEGKVVGDKAAPAVGAELDLWMGHRSIYFLPDTQIK